MPENPIFTNGFVPLLLHQRVTVQLPGHTKQLVYIKTDYILITIDL